MPRCRAPQPPCGVSCPAYGHLDSRRGHNYDRSLITNGLREHQLNISGVVRNRRRQCIYTNSLRLAELRVFDSQLGLPLLQSLDIDRLGVRFHLLPTYLLANNDEGASELRSLPIGRRESAKSLVYNIFSIKESRHGGAVSMPMRIGARGDNNAVLRNVGSWAR